MEVNLTKEMVLHLVQGVQPSYDKLSLLENFGTYSDQYGRFYWNIYKLREMSIEELYELYQRSK